MNYNYLYVWYVSTKENTLFLVWVTYCCPSQCVVRQGSWELCSYWDLLTGAVPPAPLWRGQVDEGRSLTDRYWQRFSACLARRLSSHTCLGGGGQCEKKSEKRPKTMKIGGNKVNLRLESAAAYQAVVGFFWSLGFQSACFPLSTKMKQKISYVWFEKKNKPKKTQLWSQTMPIFKLLCFALDSKVQLIIQKHL